MVQKVRPITQKQTVQTKYQTIQTTEKYQGCPKSKNSKICYMSYANETKPNSVDIICVTFYTCCTVDSFQFFVYFRIRMARCVQVMDHTLKFARSVLAHWQLHVGCIFVHPLTTRLAICTVCVETRTDNMYQVWLHFIHIGCVTNFTILFGQPSQYRKPDRQSMAGFTKLQLILD